MTRLLLIRHAESENNRSQTELLERFGDDPVGFTEAFALASVTDPGLSEIGHLQAASLAKVLAPIFEHSNADALLVSSPMRRALQTVMPLVERVGLDPARFVCQPELFEVGSRTLWQEPPSQLAKRLEAAYPLRCLGVPSDQSYLPREDRESDKEARMRITRVSAWTQALLDSFRYDIVIVVAHGHLLTRWLRQWMRIPWARGVGFTHANAGITTLDWLRGHGLLVSGVNDQSHLRFTHRTGGEPEGWMGYAGPDVDIKHYIGRSELPDALAPQLDRLRERWPVEADDECDIHMVAFAHGEAEVAGYAHYDPVNGIVRRLVVNPGHRRAGLGQHVLTEIEERVLVDLAHDQVRVRPPREMIGFFVNQGWKREEPEDGDGDGELAMVKALLDME
jgi:broad specificity phosphatase PhoE/GNAT superfamily N-acetyltransferase